MGTEVAPIRVVLADDSYLIREAMQKIIVALDGVQVAAVCGDGDSLWRAIEAERPDVVITDVRMPPSGDDEGIRVAKRLRDSYPQIGVIVLSQYAEPRYGFELFESSPEGRAYLLKERLRDKDELLAAIQVVVRGGSLIDPAMVRLLIDAREPGRGSPLMDLTTREGEVLAEMAQGKSNAAIAESLVLTKRAVEKHVGSIFMKLGLRDDEVMSPRVKAVLTYLAGGVSAPPKE